MRRAQRTLVRWAVSVLLGLATVALLNLVAARDHPLRGLPPGTAVQLPLQLQERAEGFLVVFPVPSKYCKLVFPEKPLQPSDAPFDQVINTRFNYAQVCMRHMLLADAWAERYPTLQVVIVDQRSPEAQVNEMVKNLKINEERVAEGTLARKIAAVLEVNRAPVALLIDRKGRIRDKMGGFGLQRWMLFDEQVRRAAEGRWTEVDAHAMHPPIAGKPIGYWPPSVVRGEKYTLVISELQGCAPCEAFAKQLVNNTSWLEQNPALTVNVFIAADDRPSACRAIAAWKKKWGGDWLSYPACPPAAAFRDSRKMYPPDNALPKNLHIVTYAEGSPDDVGRWWGMYAVPSATLIRGDTVVAAPYSLFPSWWLAGQTFDFGDFFAKVGALMDRSP
ncbi:TlpA family protein disulfide reductase [Deinococcota bacterium DY0809b]